MLNLLRNRNYRQFIGRSGRREERHPTAATVTLQCDAVAPVPAVLTDLSSHGARLRVPNTMYLCTPVSLEMEGMPSLDARVIWSHGEELGLCFDQPLHDAVLEHLLARPVPRRGWR